jgi:benzoyl-CoA 2,3-dioxygenase component B
VKTLLALNEVLRDDYVSDCQKGVDRWNKTIADAGIDFALRLPHRGFNRRVGTFAGHLVSPDGRLLDQPGGDDKAGEWLPTGTDREYVTSLMQGVRQVGKMASWIAPPPTGIQGKPVDYEYVKL